MARPKNKNYATLLNEKEYSKFVAEYDISTLPETLIKGNTYVQMKTGGFSDWTKYRSDERVKYMIDLYFTKLAEYLTQTVPGSTGGDQIAPSGRTGPSKPKKDSVARPARSKSIKISKATAKRISKSISVKKVEHVAEEIKFIRRFVALHNKQKKSSVILSFIKALQRSIVQKLIRKTSAFRDEIQMIQDKLINAYNSEGKSGLLNIKINNKDLPRLVSVAGGEEVYPSIRIIKRYVGMQGKELSGKVIESFSKQIENAIKNQKVANEDPYYTNVKAILNSIKKLQGGTLVRIGKVELNGLEGIVNGCQCNPNLGRIYNTRGKALQPCKRGTYSDSRGKGTCSYNKGLNGVMSAQEMVERKFDVLDFSNPWVSLFGKPEKNFSMMFHGEPHAGKSILLLKFAEYLANHFGHVLYVSSEEHDSKTLSKKLDVLMPVKPPRLGFWGNIDEPDLSLFDFVIIDSVNDLRLTINDFKRLMKEYPNTGFIVVLQHTKAGDYRGGKDWEHLVQIGAEVIKGVVNVYRNRYGVFGSLNFWQHFGTTPLQFQET